MRIPKLCWHKSNRRWFVTVDGRERYLSPPLPSRGKKPPGYVRESYNRIVRRIVELRGQPDRGVPRLVMPTVNEIYLAYLKHAKTFYVKHGRPTSEIHGIIAACRVVAEMHGDELAAEFGPVKLQKVQAAMVAKKWARGTVNDHIHRVRRMFRWAVSQELVAESVWRALQSVKGLAKGKTTAAEPQRVQAVAWAMVEATLKHCPSPLPDLVRVQRLIGCRAGEVVAMRPCEIDRDPDKAAGLWLWRPEVYKTEHHADDGSDGLAYWIGPAAQKILAPLIEAAIASPAGEAAWVFPIRYVRGNGRRRGCYSTQSYRRVIERVCEEHKLSAWTPNQIRHTRLTEVRRIAGIEAAQAVAQHSELSTTEIYAERRADLAKKVMRRHG